MQAGAIEAVKQEKAVPEKGGRNYELDFFRLVFALLIFIYHTRYFSEDVARLLPPQLGAGSVHFFFVLSGMLMANSIVKRGETQNCAKASIQFVLNKYKGFALPFIATLAIGFAQNVLIAGKGFGLRLTKLFPELFCVYSTGMWMNNSYASWYLSAMLICMLPFVYLLYAKRDLTLYVIAPLTAALSFGYMCQTNDYEFFSHTEFYGVLMGGLLRGICGLSLGICAYTICARIKNAQLNKNARIWLTIAEALLYIIFFYAWFIVRDKKAIMSVMLMLAVPVAISFSGKSYIGRLFRFRWMRHFAPLSLYIYLTNGIAEDVVEKIIPGMSYGMCTKWMTILTVLFCILSVVMVNGAKALWNHKLKEYFTKPDVE